MKNIFKLMGLLLCVSALTGCDPESVVFNNTDFIQLSDDSATSVTENSGETVTVTALLAGPKSESVTVNFDVTGDASRFTLSPGASVTIPAGETSGSISFTPVDDDEINGDVDIVIALSASNSLGIGLGGEGLSAVSKTITIVDDNVPCNDYVLTISTDTYGEESFWDILDASGNTVVSGGTGAAYPASGYPSSTTVDIPFTLADGCYTLRLFDYWGDNGITGTLSCGNLTPVNDSNGLAGIPGLDLSTVPLPGFRNGGSPPDHVSYGEAFDFCVNQ